MEQVFIIAEAGVNHNGDFETAKKLIDVASSSGCDAVKFQTFKAECLTSKFAEKCDYQANNTNNKDFQFDMIKNLELPYDWHKDLIIYAQKKGIMFLSTPFDEDSAIFLNSLDMPIFKIPSGEINNIPLLECINSFNKPIILSTGMSNINEILFALKVLKNCEVSLLHCNTDYPTKYADVNLLAMLDIKEKTGKKIGYSDHTLGIEVPIAAVALGATIIEKHITLDKNMMGPDHRASIEGDELIQMVTSIRNIELAKGKKEKAPTNSELKNIKNVRKSIVAKQAIKKGEIFGKNNIAVKRPMGGISPLMWYNVIGKIAEKDYEMDDLIEL